MAFILFISFIILIRIIELNYSAKNERWLLKNGAVEYGQKHYPVMVLMHVSFLCALIIEYTLKQPGSFNQFLLACYFILLLLKVWTIWSLGNFWNTKIYHISGLPLIIRGPYKYISHPNYILVTIEIAIIPLIFHLYYTAVIFSVLNAAMLYVRIKEEDKVLKSNESRS